MKRLKSFGINCVYTHNYGCQPGTQVSFREILAQRALLKGITN